MRINTARKVNLSSERFTPVERWVARQLGTIDHERRVTDIATTLFQLTNDLHELNDADLRLLRTACIVHDVGRCGGEEEHPEIGAEMLLADASLSLSESDRRALAYLTLYHRGPVPAAGDDAVLRRGDDHDRLRYVLSLLRAADALDSRSLESPRLVFALVGDDDGAKRLRVSCFLANDCAKARRVYRRRKKFRLLEELMGIRVEIEISTAHALRLVA